MYTAMHVERPNEGDEISFQYVACFYEFKEIASSYNYISVLIGDLSKGQQVTAENCAQWLRSKGFDVTLCSYLCEAYDEDEGGCDCEACIAAYNATYQAPQIRWAFTFGYSMDMPQDAVYFACSHMRFFTEEFVSVAKILEDADYFDYLRDIFGTSFRPNAHFPVRITHYFRSITIDTEKLLEVWSGDLVWTGPSLANHDSDLFESSLIIEALQGA